MNKDARIAVTGGRSLAHNTAWNLAGQILPLLAAVFAIPILIEGMGVERFGVFMLAWVVLGYFSLFDLGLGRALTKLVAEKLGLGQHEHVAPLTWTALWLMAGLGVLGALVVLAASGWMLQFGLGNALPSLQAEAADALLLLALSIPVVLLTTGLRGLLEAHHRFDLVNLVRIPLGVLHLVAPVAVLPFSNQLDVMVALLLGLRLAMGLAFALLCLRVAPALRRPAGISGAYARPMLRFGGWMTVTNVVGPLMVFGDRFAIGALLGAAAVAYYATPHEVITKLLFIPAAIAATLFPAFVAALASERRRAAELFHRGTRWVLLSIFPLALLAVVFAEDGLRLWISAEFALHGALVLKWLAAGVFLNSVAQIPFAFVQAAGKPDWTAKLHLAELPFYFLCLWLFMQHWGLAGAAAAWALRVAVDTAALTWMSLRIEPGMLAAIRRDALIVAACLLLLLPGAALEDATNEALFVGGILLVFVGFAWRCLLTQQERAYLRRKLVRPV